MRTGSSFPPPGPSVLWASPASPAPASCPSGTGDLRAFLSSLEEASKSPLDEILKVVSKIGKGIQVIRDCMEKCLESPSREDSEGVESAASENINKDQQAVQTCFSGFLDYAEGTRGSLSTRLDALSEEGEKISRLFAENPKKVSSSEVYAKILKIVDAFENASAANERDATNEAKRAKRDQKMIQICEDALNRNSISFSMTRFGIIRIEKI